MYPPSVHESEATKQRHGPYGTAGAKWATPAPGQQAETMLGPDSEVSRILPGTVPGS